MAVMRIQRPEGVTFEMYRAVQDKVGADDDPPTGLILHSVGEVDGALQIVDVWESEGAANRFAEERLMPAIKAVVGDQAPTGDPRGVTIYELKNLVKP